MEFTRWVLHIHKVVMDTPLFDESTFGIGDNVVHMRCETRCHHLGNELCNGMNETYGPKIGGLLGTVLLGDKCNVGGVYPMQVGNPKGMDVMNHMHDV
jgi:hypothetical protein